MALIICPDCGFEHSDAAPACPKCGRPKQVLQNLFERPRRLIKNWKTPLKDWRVKTAFSTMLIASTLLLPRLAKYSLRIWDPFSLTTWETSVAWYHDGGITYTKDCWRGGFFCSDNRDQVYRDCARLNDVQYNPKQARWVKVVNAIPQKRNVKGGSCLGTLYTINRSNTISGWERLRYAYCESPLVKKAGDNYEDYLRVGNHFWFPPGNQCWPRPMD